MANVNMQCRQFNLKWHNKTGWWGAVAVLIWAISGMSHPMMSWFGPKAVQFYPPRLTVDAGALDGMQRVLGINQITEARVLKVVPTNLGPLLQVTENEHMPRRYFSLSTGEEIIGQDKAQALWLANYYTGRNINDIADIQFQASFDQDYPWVNRLLPVYRVRFKGEDKLTAYLYTETNSLAGLTNTTRSGFQAVFQALHTWTWLDDSGTGRVLIIAFFILSLFAMAATGLALVLLIKRRSTARASRYWHRVLAYVLWIPLLAWSASGFYHLLQAAYAEQVAGLRLGNSLDLTNRNYLVSNTWINAYSGKLNALSLVKGENQRLLYRLSMPPDNAEGPVTRSNRYAGRPSEKSSLYIDTETGEQSEVSDKIQAKYLAGTITGLPADRIKQMKLVTRFGPEYDFRNKRLPVWQIDYDNAEGLRVFIDPVSGVLVDRNRQVDRYESWSFSVLHKWNHLVPVTGRFKRDVIIVITLIFCLTITGLGIMMLLRGRRKRAMRSGFVSSEAG